MRIEYFNINFYKLWSYHEFILDFLLSFIVLQSFASIKLIYLKTILPIKLYYIT